jgi:hypothetical protein
LETQTDSLTDKPILGQQKEEVPQQEIDISTSSYEVNTESIPDASISIGTQPPDDKQMEVGPSKHMEEFQEPNLE